MKIFLSWSGPRSRAVAEALNDWLPRVVQAVQPFFSAEIEKGANWSNQIDDALEGTSFGVICLTRENLQSEWIHYETGALSKTPDASIWTFLLDVEKGEVKPPLGKFQHTAAEEGDVRELVRTINRRLAGVGGAPLRDAMLDETFDDLWPRLQKRLDAVRAMPGSDLAAPSARRDIHDMMEEALELLRQQQRNVPRITEEGGIASAQTLTHALTRRRSVTYALAPVSKRLGAILVASLRASDKLLSHMDMWLLDGSPILELELRPDMTRDMLSEFSASIAAALGQPAPALLSKWAALHHAMEHANGAGSPVTPSDNAPGKRAEIDEDDS